MSADRENGLQEFVNLTAEDGRKNKIKGFEKLAAGDQHGAFQHFQSNVAEYATRERYISQRGGEPVSRDREGLYGIGPEHEDSYVPTEYVATHLSTRYSPDRVGVQAQRVSDGVFQDPYTNKVYDYNEGFKTEDGRDFPPGHAALQTSIMHLATHLDKKGLIKEATYLDVLLRKNAGFALTDQYGNRIDPAQQAEDKLEIDEIMTLQGWAKENLGLSEHEARQKMAELNAGNVESKLGPEAKQLLDSMRGTGSSEPEAEAKGRDNRPLTTGEIVALLKAHEDASSPFKLNPYPDRLAQLTNANLTEEEAAIVDGPGSMGSFSSKTIKDLIKLATHLDKKGLIKEATYIDILLRKNAGMFHSDWSTEANVNELQTLLGVAVSGKLDDATKKALKDKGLNVLHSLEVAKRTLAQPQPQTQVK